jgi:hypothetical protein
MTRSRHTLLGLLFILYSATGLHAQEPGTEFLTIHDQPELGELVLALGPIDLPAHSAPGDLAQLPVQQGVIPFDLMVRGYRVEAVDREGRSVSDAVIHHVNMLEPNRRELFLPIMRRTFAADQDTDPQELPEKMLGLPLQGGDSFLLLAKVSNPTDASYEGVVLRLVLTYERGGPPPAHRVYPFHMDVMFPLGIKAFDLPPGRTEKSWDGSPAIDGMVVGLGGHLHPYAESLTLEDLTDGKVLYQIKPEMRDDGRIGSLPTVLFGEADLGVSFYQDHLYRVTATYFNPTDETIKGGGSGTVAGAFIPEEEAAWPAPDENDPLYATDYRNVLASTTALGPGLRTPSQEFVGTATPTEPPVLPVGRNELIKFIDHPDEQVLEMVVGPASLSAAGMHLRLPIQLVELPFEGWLHGFEWEITDAEGTKLSDDLLHHINLIDPDNREMFAPVPRRIMAAGRETSKQAIPRFLGYPIEAGTRVLVSAMFAKPAERDYDEVYLHVRLAYTSKGEAPAGIQDIYPFYLDVMGPVSRKSFSIPPGGTVRSWTASPAVDGRIVAIGAHLHHHATSIRLEHLDTGEVEVLWEVKPDRGPDGHVSGVPTTLLLSGGGVPIYKDHRYRLVVEYENKTDSYDPEPGMGEIGGAIIVSVDAEWPELDRQNALYVADLMNTLEAPHKLQGH